MWSRRWHAAAEMPTAPRFLPTSNLFACRDQGRIQGELQGLAAPPQWKLAPLRRVRRCTTFHRFSPSITARGYLLHRRRYMGVFLPARRRRRHSDTKRRPFRPRRRPSNQIRRPSSPAEVPFWHEKVTFPLTAHSQYIRCPSTSRGALLTRKGAPFAHDCSLLTRSRAAGLRPLRAGGIGVGDQNDYT